MAQELSNVLPGLIGRLAALDRTVPPRRCDGGCGRLWAPGTAHPNECLEHLDGLMCFLPIGNKELVAAGGLGQVPLKPLD